MGLFSGWVVKKEIGLGEILTIVSVVGSMALSFGWVLYQYDKRIEKNTFVNDTQAVQIQNISNQIEANRLEQKADLNRLDGKLDDIRNLIIQQGK